MKLLGVLGLDWKVFIIQTLNFLALFFILKWLFFRPFIEALKKEKKETEEINLLKSKIEEEKRKVLEEKEREISEMKKRITAIMAEAEETAKKIKETSQKELSEKERLALERIKKQSQAILDEYKEKMINNYKNEIFSNLLTMFEKEIPQSVRKIIENSFWPVFFKKVGQLEIKQASKDISRKKLLLSFKNIKKERKKYLEIKKVDIKVSSSFGFLPRQRKNLSLILKNKFKLEKIEIIEDRSTNLLAGFRLEAGGILIEESLREKLLKAINYGDD